MNWLLACAYVYVPVASLLVARRIILRRRTIVAQRERRARERAFVRTRRRHGTGFATSIQTRRWVHVVALTTDELVSADERRRKVETYLDLFSVINMALRTRGRS